MKLEYENKMKEVNKQHNTFIKNLKEEYEQKILNINNNDKIIYHEEIYENGDKYEGDWKNGLKEGKGVYYYKNGNRYEGDYQNDKREGKGIKYYKNGDKYEGDWKNNN